MRAVAPALRPALRRWRLSWWLPPLLLTAVWLLAELAVNPLGSFPLADDWTYALGAKHLAETGRIDPSLPTSTTLVAHTVWGALFVKLFGYSFFTLRMSVLVLSLLGLLALYQLGRECGLRPDRAFVLAVLIGLNPLYLKLSNSYMTDVSFAAVGVISLWLLVRAVRLRRDDTYVLAVVAMLVAVFIRQLGLALPIGAAVGIAIRREWVGRGYWRAWLPAVICFGAYFGYGAWLTATHTDPLGYRVMQAEGLIDYIATQPGRTLKNIGVYGGRMWLYWGIFLLPLLLFRYPKRPDRMPAIARVIDILCGILFGGWAIAALLKGNLYTLGDHIFDFGLGPITAKGAFALGSPGYGQLPTVVWTLLSLAGAVGATLLVRVLLYHLAHIWNHFRLLGSVRAYWIDLAMYALLVAYLLPIMPRGLFERYLLFAWVPIQILVLRTTEPWLGFTRAGRTALAVAVSLPLVYFSIAGTHDYLAWSRARWAAWLPLKAQGIAIEDVDAGYEINNYEGYRTWPDHESVVPGKSWWVFRDDRYVIGFDQPPGYRQIGEVKWQQWLWLPPRTNGVRTYERLETAPDSVGR